VQENDKSVLIYSTFPNPEAAETIGRELVEGRLAACINILPGMTSIYRWENAIVRDGEAAMIIKTRQSLAEQVIGKVRSLHPYTNPALIVLPITGGSPDYVRWLLDETIDPEAGRTPASD